LQIDTKESVLEISFSTNHLHIDYDLIVIGAGPSGMIAAIIARRRGKKVLLLEKLPKIGTKLKATGGGRCNLSNTLISDDFIQAFGKTGRFMQTAIEKFDHTALRDFFAKIGVETDVLDGFHIFPVGHNSQTVLLALSKHMHEIGVTIACDQKVTKIKKVNGIFYLETEATKSHKKKNIYTAKSVLLSTGGKGYPRLGAEGDGYELARSLGHDYSSIFPAMMPLKVKESWVEKCRADTTANAHIIVDIKKYRKLQAIGDLIFTKNGIRGPVVLDFSREITPLLKKEIEVPILINMTKGMNEEQIRTKIKDKLSETKPYSTLQLLETFLPSSISEVLCELAEADTEIRFGKQKGITRDKLIKLLAWTPLTIIGHDGFDKAMITRGGIRLKEIDSKTMQSKLVDGLYFCGEIVDLDGPCGGYNLQWAFSSGYLAGVSI